MLIFYLINEFLFKILKRAKDCLMIRPRRTDSLEIFYRLNRIFYFADMVFEIVFNE